MPETNKIIKPEDILKARNVVREVYLDEKIENYITDIVFASRFPSEYKLRNLRHSYSTAHHPGPVSILLLLPRLLHLSNGGDT